MSDIQDDDAFIYQRHKTSAGIKLETVGGCSSRDGRVWLLLARQIWSENARNGYRQIDHSDTGAPILVADEPNSEYQRISVSHTKGLLVIATLPPVQDADPEYFSEKTALGVDVERIDREQVLRVRSRFLNDNELSSIEDNDIQTNITAWTCKEAMLKLSLNASIDIRQELILEKLPILADRCNKQSEIVEFIPGRGKVTLQDGREIDIELHSIILQGKYIVTIACTAATQRYGGK